MRHTKNRRGNVLCAVFVSIIGMLVFFGCGAGNGNGGNDPNAARKGSGEEKDIMNRVKQDYFNQLIKPLDANVPFEALEIEKEHGVFDGYIVIRFNTVIAYPSSFTPIEIGGVVLDWDFANRIIAWKDGQVFTLISAQEDNILSQENLREIALEHELIFDDSY